MGPVPTKTVAILVSAGLVLGGVVGVVGVVGADHLNASESEDRGIDDADRRGDDGPEPTSIQADRAGQAADESACAATPPDDRSDPPSDVIGWENGTWHDASIAVDQSDGLNRSEVDALVARTMARVEAVRCVEFDRNVPVSVIDRDTFRERGLQREVSPTSRTFDNAKFEALFLIDEDTDSIEVQRRNRGESVLGYYSSQSGEIVLVAEDRESLRIGEFTLAHELVHAWQDDAFDLGAEPLAPRLRDEANARNGLVEGDARYVQHRYEQRCRAGAWNGTCETPPGDGAGSELANLGVYLLNYQPYSDGPTFVRTVRTVGGWDAVDALYDRPPASTEQVIHVERYGTDEPAPPTVEDRTTDDWTRVEPPGRPNHASMGEAALVSTFAFPYYHSEGDDPILPPDEWLNYDEQGEVDDFDPLDYESNYTEGWDGDRLHVYRNETNETAYVWRLAWDSPQDAREFVAGYRQVLQYWGGDRVGPNTYRIPDGGFADAFHVAVDGTTVTIVNAPTVEQLAAVRTEVDAAAARAAPGASGSLAPADRTGVVRMP